MSARDTERGLRLALLGVAGLTASGLAGELLLIGHLESLVQLLPLALAGLALALAGALAARPGPRLARAARALALALALGAALGVWEHLEGNLAFEREIRPNASEGERALAALTGANPLLAPGALVAVALALGASTWRLPP